MEAEQPGALLSVAQPQVVQQQAAAACVLAGDAIHVGQHVPGARGEIADVANRCSHQIEHACSRFGGLHQTSHRWLGFQQDRGSDLC